MAEYRDAESGARAARDELLAQKRVEMREVVWLARERSLVGARLVLSATLLAGVPLVLVVGPGTSASRLALGGTLAGAVVLSWLGARRGAAHVIRAIAHALATTDDVGADLERLRALHPSEWAGKRASKRRGLAASLVLPAVLATFALGFSEVRAVLSPLDADARLGVRFHVTASTLLLLGEAIRRARRFEAGKPTDGDSTSISLRWIAGPLWGAALASALQGAVPETGAFVGLFYGLLALGVFLTLWVAPKTFDSATAGYRASATKRAVK